MNRCSALFVVLVAVVGCSDQAAIPPETDGGVDGSAPRDGILLQDGALPGDQLAEGIVMRDGVPPWPDLGRDGGTKICGPFPGGGAKGSLGRAPAAPPGAPPTRVPSPTTAPAPILALALTCAVSATGYGEDFMRTVIAKTISDFIYMKGMDAKEATEAGIEYLSRKVSGRGGVIVIDD